MDPKNFENLNTSLFAIKGFKMYDDSDELEQWYPKNFKGKMYDDNDELEQWYDDLDDIDDNE